MSLGSDTGEVLGWCADIGRGVGLAGIQSVGLTRMLTPTCCFGDADHPRARQRDIQDGVQSTRAQSMSGRWTGTASNLRLAQAADLPSLTSANSLLKVNSRAEGQVAAGCDSLATGAPRPLAHRHAADSCCSASVRQLPNCGLALLCCWALLLQVSASAMLQERPAVSLNFSCMGGGSLPWSTTAGVLQKGPFAPALPVLLWALRQWGALPPRCCFTTQLGAWLVLQAAC